MDAILRAARPATNRGRGSFSHASGTASPVCASSSANGVQSTSPRCPPVACGSAVLSFARARSSLGNRIHPRRRPSGRTEVWKLLRSHREPASLHISRHGVPYAPQSNTQSLGLGCAAPAQAQHRSPGTWPPPPRWSRSSPGIRLLGIEILEIFGRHGLAHARLIPRSPLRAP